MTPRRVAVHAGVHAYEVCIGFGLIESLGTISKSVLTPPPRRVLIVADANLPTTTVETAHASLAETGMEVHAVTCMAVETEKSIAAFERLHTQAAAIGLDRHDAFIALGGGITGDLTGFVAATHRRGIRVIQCPTTLLAMVDASVGGKTGVNLVASGMLLKNFVGAFHQPECVMASIDTLASLDPRQFRSGLGECLKHAMIAGPHDPTLTSWTHDHLDEILAHNTEKILELIERNVAVKAAIVATDERETAATGGRALLNLGHTFAHAIETIPSLSPDNNPRNAPLLHGEAVGLGLVAASATATHMGLIPESMLEDTMTLVRRAGLPVRVAGLPSTDEVLERMSHDKKALGGTMRVIVPTSPGQARVVQTPPLDALRAGIDALRDRS